MSDEEIRQKLNSIVRQLAYETNRDKIAVLQGRLQIALETMDERGRLHVTPEALDCEGKKWTS
jgi:hypothetical protein